MAIHYGMLYFQQEVTAECLSEYGIKLSEFTGSFFAGRIKKIRSTV